MSDNDGPNYDETFFVLGELQDIFYFASLVISGLGVILCCLTSFIYFKKEHKQSKDIYSCALAFCDALCNATGVLFTLSRLSSWGYTHLSCVSVIYLWRAIPTLSWALVLSIAVTRYFAVIKYDFFKRNFSKKVVAVNMIGIVVFSLIAAIPFPLECNRVINVTDAELKGATRPQPGDYVYTINSGISIDANEARHQYVAYYRLALVSIIAFALIYLYGRVIHDLKRRATARKRLTAQLRRESQSMQRLEEDSLQRQRSATLVHNISLQLDHLTAFFTGATEKVKSHLQVTFGFSDDSDLRTEVMFINVAVFFALTNLPYIVVEMIDDLRKAYNPNPKTTSLFLLIFVIGFNLNPFIFYVSNPWFKSQMNAIFLYPCRGKKQDKKVHQNGVTADDESSDGTEMTTTQDADLE